MKPRELSARETLQSIIEFGPAGLFGRKAFKEAKATSELAKRSAAESLHHQYVSSELRKDIRPNFPHISPGLTEAARLSDARALAQSESQATYQKASDALREAGKKAAIKHGAITAGGLGAAGLYAATRKNNQLSAKEELDMIIQLEEQESDKLKKATVAALTGGALATGYVAHKGAGAFSDMMGKLKTYKTPDGAEHKFPFMQRVTESARHAPGIAKERMGADVRRVKGALHGAKEGVLNSIGLKGRIRRGIAGIAVAGISASALAKYINGQIPARREIRDHNIRIKSDDEHNKRLASRMDLSAADELDLILFKKKDKPAKKKPFFKGNPLPPGALTPGDSAGVATTLSAREELEVIQFGTMAIPAMARQGYFKRHPEMMESALRKLPAGAEGYRFNRRDRQNLAREIQSYRNNRLMTKGEGQVTTPTWERYKKENDIDRRVGLTEDRTRSLSARDQLNTILMGVDVRPRNPLGEFSGAEEGQPNPGHMKIVYAAPQEQAPPSITGKNMGKLAAGGAAFMGGGMALQHLIEKLKKLKK